MSCINTYSVAPVYIGQEFVSVLTVIPNSANITQKRQSNLAEKISGI